MPKYCSENEKVKRAYTFYLEAASGKQNATIDSALRAIARFEGIDRLQAFQQVWRGAGQISSGLASSNPIPMASC